MARALRLARRGWGRVAPNPMVGAVLVRDGEVIGEGWHREYGGPHAEVDAIARAGDARGATMYVSLEPCAHHGHTPPCTDAILRAGVTRVVFASPDPNPTAAGGGSVLEAHGIDVRAGVLEEEARRLNAAFLHAHETGRPWVALKLAQSLDGALGRRGESTRLTGPRAQAWTHRLRAGFDAVLVGAATARTDDPLLTVRAGPPPRIAPVRVVLDSGATLRTDSRLVRTVEDAPVHVVHADAPSDRLAALAAAGVQLHRVPAATGGVALDAALRALWSVGLRSVLCEGGAALAGALISADLVERLYLWVAPTVIGAGVPAWTRPLPGDWRLARTRRAGPDALLVYDRQRQSAAR